MSTEPTPPKTPEPPRKAEWYAAVRDWPGYFRVVLGKPPRETLVAALDAFEREGFRSGAAVDLGCGEGRDTLELLRRGWSVVAIDSTPQAFEHLRARTGNVPDDRLRTQVATFEQARWPTVDLVNSSFSLPFCDPAHFDAVWSRIVASIRPGGRFAGQLFGDRDGWASLPDRSHQTRAKVETMLSGFRIEMFNEEEKDGNEPGGIDKHWHVFHIVARKDPAGH